MADHHIVTGLRGRDGSSSSPLLIAADMALEAVNVDFYRTAFANKRNGCIDVFALTTSESVSTTIGAVMRHQPSNDPGAQELWIVDNANPRVVQRLAGGTAWSTPTLKDAITTGTQRPIGCTFNGMLYLAYDSAVDRLHVWDGSTVRRTGLATPAAPTAANTGSGTYPAVGRGYVVRYVTKSGSVYQRVSELSDGVIIVPSGSGTAVRITKPAAINEGETHWQIYASSDTVGHVLQFVDEVAVGTTTYDDDATAGDWSTTFAPLVGQWSNWPSVRYLTTDGQRLIGAGSYESTTHSRVWFSNTTIPIDEFTLTTEYVPQTTDVSNYLDVGEKDGGYIVGLGGPLDGAPLVFKNNQVWRLIVSGNDNPVYLPRPIFKDNGIGCLDHYTIVMAEDEAGRPAVYWLSQLGPYRIGSDGPQFLGEDIQDIWDTVNVSGTLANWTTMHGVYYAAKKQIWWWVATGSATTPSTLIVFDVRKGRVTEAGSVRGGWSQFSTPGNSGEIEEAFASVMFPSTLGTSMTGAMKPYIGVYAASGSKLWKADTGTDDAGTPFQAYVDLPDRHLAGLGKKCRLGNAAVLGSAGAHEVSVTYTQDYGRQSIADAVSMDAQDAETRTMRVAEGVQAADAMSVAIRVGDATETTDAWTIDALVVPYAASEDVVSL